MSCARINRDVVTLPAAGDSNLLDHLRDGLGLTAAKPACHGGDCGACLVLVGETDGDSVRYRAVNSCLATTGQVTGCHVITPEALAEPDALTPVQEALITHGAIQCGYCTPGLVVALTAALLNGDDLLDSTAGNLCRCTGYSGIRRACDALAERLPRQRRTLAEAAEHGLLSSTLVNTAAVLPPADASPPPSTKMQNVVAGGTDWSVQRRHLAAGTVPVQLHRRADLRRLVIDGDGFSIGAAVTVAELMAESALLACWPAIGDFLALFASPAIRNSATVGGNLANASPVADIAVLLLALGAELELVGPQGVRRLPLAGFYRGYRRTALAPGELIAQVMVCRDPPRLLRTAKTAKRPHDDIATVSSALTVTDGGPPASSIRFGAVLLSAGGVAPTPLLLANTATALNGQPVTEAAVLAALAALPRDIAPINDLRGGAGYKAALLRHQIIDHLVSLYPSLSLPALLAGSEVAP
jgi:xanthine dehydrogenase small subunit